MLIPLTREKFDELVPKVATAEQYRYCWGKPVDLLRRILISGIGVAAVFFLRLILGSFIDPLVFAGAAAFGTYWLWVPVYVASRRNRELRRNAYGGFWRGRVLDVYTTDDVISTGETVNQQGELVIIENRERQLNLEVGDRSGFYTTLQVPLKRDHRLIRRGDPAEMVVASNREDLSRLNAVSDIFIPDARIWVSDYPYLRKDIFQEVRRQIQRQLRREEDRRQPPPEPIWE
ncbi:MAG: phosphate ABC transporter permease [Leptolyngbya sp. SIO4C1]|nr:phosphate ABC transporter permease [Leptolyngbya sp. SIO4C1]